MRPMNVAGPQDRSWSRLGYLQDVGFNDPTEAFGRMIYENRREVTYE